MCLNNNIWAHENFWIEDDSIWFVPYYDNLLCQYDLSKNLITEVKAFKGTDNKIDGYINVIKNMNYIVMIPSYADVLVVYDIMSQKSHIRKIEKCDGTKYFQSILFNDRALVFPYMASNILEVDTTDGEIIINESKCNIDKISSCILINDEIIAVRRDEKIYRFEYGVGFEAIQCVEGACFTDLSCFSQNIFLVVDMNGCIYSCDCEDNSIKKVVETDIAYHSIAVYKDNIIAFPEKGLSFDVINYNSKVRNRKNIGDEEIGGWAAHSYSKAKFYKNKIYVMNNKIQVLVEVDVDSDTYSTYKMNLPEISDEDLKTVFNSSSGEVMIERANSVINLPQFIKSISL